MPDESKHLSDLRALAEARKRATPGKQWIDGASSDDAVIRGELPTFFFARVVMRHPENEAMADLYARAANHDFPGLIAHLEKLERENAQWRKLDAAIRSNGGVNVWRKLNCDDENPENIWHATVSDLNGLPVYSREDWLAAALAALETKHG